MGGADRESREVSMLAPHLLQSALVFVNTHLVQAVLKDPARAGRLTDADRRALSPLFRSHANLYGTIRIGVDTHLDLGPAARVCLPVRAGRREAALVAEADVRSG
ncbi:Tn3 family transposase [Streptosporangium canum]|uniref:Tn3 family transposase n=1 Tax=Streptosporangium canum TaxID=324952 RepID=UPI00342D0195